MDGDLDWIVLAPLLAFAAVLALWLAGSLFYDVSGGARWGRWLAAGWVGGVTVLFTTWRPLWQPLALFFAGAVPFLVWWLRLKPSQDRDWDPCVAVLARATRAGDAITIENVRNFEYRSLQDYTPRYETRTYHLSNLVGANIIFFNWGIALMSHPVFVFDFGPDGRVCVSIEARFRRGQRFSASRSLYRQQELIFLVADERDAILRRTKHGWNQNAHMYRFIANPDELRVAFLDYIGAVNSLYETPRWYHGLWANCTTSYYRLPNSRCRYDWRVLANGRLDRALYATGRLDRTLPFPELRRSAYLNDIANSAPEVGFGDHIRRELRRAFDRSCDGVGVQKVEEQKES
jgi:hypothetical protein